MTAGKAPKDLNQAEAIVDLLSLGWKTDRIIGALGISRRTYFNRLKEIRESDAAPRIFTRDPAACR